MWVPKEIKSSGWTIRYDWDGERWEFTRSGSFCSFTISTEGIASLRAALLDWDKEKDSLITEIEEVNHKGLSINKIEVKDDKLTALLWWMVEREITRLQKESNTKET